MLRTLLIVAVSVLPVILPLIAFAQTAARDATTYSLRHWGMVLGMALLGGLVNWWGQVRRGEVRVTSISSLIGELCTSAFAGLIAFFICDWANFPTMLTGAMAGICGHMGTRAITMFEDWATKKFGALADTPPNKP